MAVTLERGSEYQQKALKTLGELPPFSPILNRLLADLGRDDVSFGKLSDLIEKDTVIAGNILRVVNSALYGRRGTVNSVRNAVSVLGLNKLRNFVLGMSVARMWHHAGLPKTFSTVRFNLHGVATAILADLIAQHRPIEYPEGAFVAGLFHDLGKMLIAIGMPKEYEEIHKIYQQGGRRLTYCEQAVMGVDHAGLSGVAVHAWNLPEPIQSAVIQHHQHSTEAAGPKDLIALARCIAAADHYVNSQGHTVDAEIQAVDMEGPDTLESMGLGDKTEGVLKQYQAELDAISSFFK
jgi:HD-like signal output (HDOD) protein